MTGEHDATLHWFEAQLAAAGETRWELTLFVSGASDLAARAIANASQLCETYLHNRYRLSVVDVQDNTTALEASGVLATPTLVRNSPLPKRRVVGDLSSTDRVLLALELPSTTPTSLNAG